MVCPSCNRPVATSRPACLYCGAPLPQGTPPRQDAAGPAPGPADETGFVILDLASADPGKLADTLGLAAFDADQRMKRGGFLLWRCLPLVEAKNESRRLLGEGLSAFAIPGSEVVIASKPRMVVGGSSRGGLLALRFRQGGQEVDAPAMLLVVKGPITRQYPPSPTIRRARIATLETGYRVHLHLRDLRTPLEIDPGNFDFGDAQSQMSSLLTLLDWVASATAGVPNDDAFRYETPALSPAPREESGPTAAAGIFAKPKAAGGEAPQSLDNLGQFRFYSAWRAVVERARQDRLAAPSGPMLPFGGGPFGGTL